MGLFGKDRATISASEVVKLVLGDRPHAYDKEAIARGHQEHERILDSLGEQVNMMLPGFVEPRQTIVDIPAGHVLASNKRLKTQITDQLAVTVQPDAIVLNTTENVLTCLEVKSARTPAGLLQLAIGCMAADDHFGQEHQPLEGMLVTYNQAEGDRVMTLLGGGSLAWDDIRDLISLAAEMQTSQQPDKADPNFTPTTLFVGDMPIVRESERAVIIRNEMNEIFKDVSAALWGMVDYKY